jgi:hypothetical protein
MRVLFNSSETSDTLSSTNLLETTKSLTQTLREGLFASQLLGQVFSNTSLSHDLCSKALIVGDSGCHLSITVEDDPMFDRYVCSTSDDNVLKSSDVHFEAGDSLRISRVGDVSQATEEVRLDDQELTVLLCEICDLFVLDVRGDGL